MSKLSDLLTEANRRHPMATRKRAERVAGRLHHATIAAYQRGSHPSHPDEATLQALADAYDLKLPELQSAAGVQVGAGPYVPPKAASRLSERQQAAITELIMSMVERGGSSDGRQPDAQKITEQAGEAVSVRPLTRKQRQMLEDAQEVDRAADDRQRASEDEEE